MVDRNIKFENSKGCILVNLQYMENYNWDDDGDINPYWKYKGGEDVIIPGDSLELFIEKSGYVYANSHSRQYILGTEVLSEDFVFEIPDYIEEYEIEAYTSCMGPKVWKGVE